MNVIRNFSPAWGAAVMGTGITAITSCQMGLKGLGIFLFYLNIVMFFTILTLWVLRFVLYPDAIRKDLNHPIVAHFFPTVPIGALVLASDFLIVGKGCMDYQTAVYWAKVIWLFGMVGTIFFAVLITALVFIHPSIDMTHGNCGWLIPPVGAIVIPTSGALLVPYWSSATVSQYMLLICVISWGIGFFYYLFLNASLIHRFIYHELPPKQLAATMWIGLGPVGVGVISLNNIVHAALKVPVFSSFFSHSVGALHLFSAVFWGFGVFWFLVTVILTLYYLVKVSIPYAMSWWAFTFPLGAYTAATFVLYKEIGLTGIKYYGALLFVLLLFFWAITFVNTMKAAFSGKLFAGK